jgi:uncharacterized membrane protein
MTDPHSLAAAAAATTASGSMSGPSPAVPTVRPTRGKPLRMQCAYCGREHLSRDLVRMDIIRPSVLERLRALKPDLPNDGFVCRADLDASRSSYIAELLTSERGELTQLENDVVKSLADHEIMAEDIEHEFTGHRTFGERLSDQLATFGGSWMFLILFGAFLVLWMGLNAILIGREQFDPYPFILLNLILSTLAAIQAPIIMMSQKRQETKDRLRSENDYRVNLKAELEIRHLHEKIDHILTRQWERLAEIQQIQLEIMQDLAGRRR